MMQHHTSCVRSHAGVAGFPYQARGGVSPTPPRVLSELRRGGCAAARDRDRDGADRERKHWVKWSTLHGALVDAGGVDRVGMLLENEALTCQVVGC